MPKRFVPTVELLEDRCVPANVDWRPQGEASFASIAANYYNKDTGAPLERVPGINDILYMDDNKGMVLDRLLSVGGFRMVNGTLELGNNTFLVGPNFGTSDAICQIGGVARIVFNEANSRLIISGMTSAIIDGDAILSGATGDFNTEGYGEVSIANGSIVTVQGGDGTRNILDVSISVGNTFITGLHSILSFERTGGYTTLGASGDIVVQQYGKLLFYGDPETRQHLGALTMNVTGAIVNSGKVSISTTEELLIRVPIFNVAPSALLVMRGLDIVVENQNATEDIVQFLGRTVYEGSATVIADYTQYGGVLSLNRNPVQGVILTEGDYVFNGGHVRMGELDGIVQVAPTAWANTGDIFFGPGTELFIKVGCDEPALHHDALETKGKLTIQTAVIHVMELYPLPEGGADIRLLAADDIIGDFIVSYYSWYLSNRGNLDDYFVVSIFHDSTLEQEIYNLHRWGLAYSPPPGLIDHSF